MRHAGLKCAVALSAIFATTAQAQDSNQELAKKLSNPVAAMISVPFQFNYDRGYGPNDGSKSTLNIQPVIPLSVNADWTVISRTILPVTSQNDIEGASGSQFGLGDTTQSFFVSPAKPTESGIIWGVGPAFLIPTATDDLLGSEKWGIGPTVVVLKQEGEWTYGALANHIWSFAGSDERNDISSTFLQPFLSYTTKDAWTFSLNTESTYDWKADEWTVPINVNVSKLFTIDKQPISLGAGVRYWAAAPDNGPEGLGVRLTLTFLFPK
ncbi:hypothetical protein [Ensifer sp. LC163]|uniref:hypothetical protein n=1 Tax=Ensifer sp. LC163 TaxID=1120652 RepID=UPI00081374CE|nr:hypothetical protein [Ensifer sp. LC163]OCP38769.1 hypothetical protein BC360_01570 [Ensifer sp. LC163]